MKKLLVLVILGISIALLPNFSQIAKAESITSENNEGQFFNDYIKEFFKDTKKVNVTNSYGMDYTEEFLSVAENLYTQNKLQEIKKFIVDNKLSISYERETVESKPINNKEIAMLSTLKTVTSTKSFYHSEFDTKNKFEKEWITYLTGNFTYNTSTYQIVSAPSPSFSLSANFGASFVANADNLSTQATISGDKVTYKASYKMTATAGISIGGYGIGVPISFGNYTDQYHTYAGITN